MFGFYVFNVVDGKCFWFIIEENCCLFLSIWGCGFGFFVVIMLILEVVFGGILDGFLKVYVVDDGWELWVYDIKKDFEVVNGVKVFGGVIDLDGLIVVEN